MTIYHLVEVIIQKYEIINIQPLKDKKTNEVQKMEKNAFKKLSEPKFAYLNEAKRNYLSNNGLYRLA